MRWDNHIIEWDGTSFLFKEIVLIIDAVCQDQRTGGPWSRTNAGCI